MLYSVYTARLCIVGVHTHLQVALRVVCTEMEDLDSSWETWDPQHCTLYTLPFA